MYRGADVIYLYDGSYAGLMCCIFESVYRRELPLSIAVRNDTLFPSFHIQTDAAKAARVLASVPKRLSVEAAALIRDVYFSCAAQREMLILRFLLLGYAKGDCVAMESHPDVQPLLRAQRNVLGEAHLLKGFVRFADVGGALVSEITPKNFVLPYLQPHFLARLSGERFLIYDRTHGAILLCEQGKPRIIEGSFTPPPPGAEELRYQALWKRFYDTIAIQARNNPRCRMSNCPKRFWENMTELAEEYRLGTGGKTALTEQRGIAAKGEDGAGR